jgi:hypothetical protein
MHEHDDKAAALQAITRIRLRASRGDREAVQSLLEIATTATGHLAALASYPEEMSAAVETRRAAAMAERWPVNVPAIGEHRPRAFSSIPPGLGSALPFRAAAGPTKRRDFEGYTGLALTAFHDIEAVRAQTPEMDRDGLVGIWHLLPESLLRDWRTHAKTLPPLTPATVPAWTAASSLWAEDQCQGQWKVFPWPVDILDRAVQRTNSRQRGVETAVREYLGKGLASLARPLPLIAPE